MTTTSFTYRAHRPTVVARLRARLEELREETRGERVRERLAVHRRRVARTVAGCVGATGALVMLLTGLVAVATNTTTAVPAAVLGGALVAMPIGYLVAFLLAPAIERRRLGRLLSRSDQPERDLAIVEQASARSVVSTWAERWERASLTMPLLAVALLGPLALHGVFFVPDHDWTRLTAWVGMSAVIVGHAHLVFAGLAARYVRQLRTGTLPTHPALRTWGWVVLTSAIPGVMLFGLPPIITGVTGALLVFPAFKWAEVALNRERQALA